MAKKKDEIRSAEPSSLKDALQKYFVRIDFAKAAENLQIVKLWHSVVEEKYDKHTKLVGFRHGILTVEVDSSTYYFELNNFKKQEILQALQKNCPLQIVDIHWICSGAAAS